MYLSNLSFPASKEENEQFEENKQDNIKVEPAMPSFREVKHTGNFYL